MPHSFALTPHTESILRGRLLIGEDSYLQCAATKCIYETPEKGFGKDIRVIGYVECPKCKTKINYPDDLEFIESTRSSILRCSICKQVVSMRLVKWTQFVVSKHRGRKHEYFHEECFNARYIDLGDDDGE